MMDYAVKEVAVETAQIGRMRVLASVGDLARYLLEEWPDDAGEKHRAAREACLEALAGKISPGVARIAFLEAAEQDNVWTMATQRPESTGKVEHRFKRRGAYRR
ncbi:DUF982 domain-containing protein [Phyllobacterium myrsinacearum]|uniref:DUF982 domain-containing protein n=1 Tax=Phyllobacterium myrsinacearum TaxID=28101 RepID=A0A839EYY1_9HYPH|nr:DUF982 domain-containing protein [Phyllobacterium myrsinacearum]MBA8881680.1 hypothetical protein [Phyllobacterium myrsinacearum]